AVTLSAGDGLSGGGDISASRSFAVDATVVRTSRTLTAGNGLTGGGDLSANRAFNLQTPGTVSAQSSNSAVEHHTHAVTASSNPGENERLLKSNASGWLQLERLGLGVSPDHPLHVSGDSFFDGSVGVGVETPEAALHSVDDAGAQLRLGYDADNYSDFTVAATGTLTVAPTNNLRLQPAGDIVLDPVGLDVLPGQGYEVNLGQLSNKYLTLHAAELWVETLVAQDTMATIGGRILVGPTTTLIADLNDTATSIDVEHNQMSNGDIAYLEADGKVEFIAIDSAPSSITGGYRYTVTRNLDGSGADEWFAGDALFNTGQSGDGFIDLYSFAGVTSGTSGPTIVGNVRASSTYNDWVEHWAIGNLNGLYDYGTDTYGVAFGGYGEANYLTIDPINGIRFFDESDMLRAQLSSDTWTLGHTDTAHIELTPSKLSMLDDAGDEKIVLGDAGDSYFAGVMTIGADGEIRQGSGTLGTNFTGLRIWRDSNIGRIAGYNDDDLQWYADTDGRLYAGGGSIFLDSNGLSLDITDGYNANEAVTFYRSSTRVADLYANFIPDPVSTNELYLMLQDPGGSDEPYLYMYSDGFAAGGSITLHSDQMTMDGFTQVVGNADITGTLDVGSENDIRFRIDTSETGDPYNLGFSGNPRRMIVVSEQGSMNQAMVLGDASVVGDTMFGLSSATDGSTWVPKFVVTQGGKVGIGQTDPGARLTVIDDGSKDIGLIRRDSVTTGHQSLLSFAVSTGVDIRTAAIGVERDSGSGSGDIIFLTGDAGSPELADLDEKMRIQRSTGNVGIGHDDPASRLTILENTDDFAVMVTNGGNASNRNGIAIRAGQFTDPSAAFLGFYSGDDSQFVGSILGDGSGGVNYTSSSDERIKDDIRSLDGGLATTLAMRPVTYRGKGAEKDGRRALGLVAQELRDVAPEAVSEMEGGLLGIDYGRLTPIAIAAIQEQHETILALEARIEELEAMRV
ncbi:MAG: tail fiber domain-containing protein, partial [Chloroflexota bacterium]